MSGWCQGPFQGQLFVGLREEVSRFGTALLWGERQLC